MYLSILIKGIIHGKITKVDNSVFNIFYMLLCVLFITDESKEEYTISFKHNVQASLCRIQILSTCNRNHLLNLFLLIIAVQLDARK